MEDVAASGGYWIASAADEIYADHASIIGSIGEFPQDLVCKSCFQDMESRGEYIPPVNLSRCLIPLRKKAEDVKRLKDILSQLRKFLYRM